MSLRKKIYWFYSLHKFEIDMVIAYGGEGNIKIYVTQLEIFNKQAICLTVFYRKRLHNSHLILFGS